MPLVTRRSSGSRLSRRPRRLDTDSRHGDHAAASTHAGSRDPRRCVPHPFSLSCLDKIRLPRANLCGSDLEYYIIWLLLYRLLFFFNIISWEQSPSHKKKVGGRSVLALIRDQLTSGALSSSVLYIFCPLDQRRLAFAGYACMGVMSDLKCANQVSQKLSIN
jgi:hypothetical protein